MARKQKPTRPKSKPAPKAASKPEKTPASKSKRSQKKPLASSNPLGKWVWLPAIFGCLLYLNTVPNEYTIDDGLVLSKNKYVLEGISGIPDILSHNFIHGFQGTNDGLYRPLSQVTFAIEQSLFGPEPWHGHLVNALLMGLIGWLICLFLARLWPTGPPWFPLIAALLFVAHPIHTEAVANIKGRDEMLALLNFLAAGWFALGYFDQKKGKDLIWSGVFFALALLSKESALTFLAVLPLMLYFFRELPLVQTLKHVIPWAVVGGLWFILRTSVLNSIGSEADEGVFGLLNNSLFGAENLLEEKVTAIWLQVLYFWKLVLPYPLLHDHSFNQIPVMGLNSGKAWLGIVFLAGNGFLIVKYWKQRQVWLFGLLFYLGTLVIVSNLLFLIGSTFAERFLFAPSFGFALLSAWMLGKLVKRPPGKGAFDAMGFLKTNSVFTLIFLGIIGLYSLQTLVRNAQWSSNLALFEADAPHLDNSARAHYNLGSELMRVAQFSENPTQKSEAAQRAISELTRAIEIYPDYSDAANNLANAYTYNNQTEQAVVVLDQLMERDPTYRKGQYNRAYYNYSLKRYELALQQWKAYLAGDPNNANALYVAGDCLGNLQRFDEAIQYLNQAISIDPSMMGAQVLLGQAYAFKGDVKNAVAVLSKATQIDPNNAGAYDALGIAYMIGGQPQKAVAPFEAELRLKPNDSQTIQKLAEAYEKSGNPQKAAELRNRLQR